MGGNDWLRVPRTRDAKLHSQASAKFQPDNTSNGHSTQFYIAREVATGRDAVGTGFRARSAPVTEAGSCQLTTDSAAFGSSVISKAVKYRW